MSEITIKTNKQKRPLINFWELSQEDQEWYGFDRQDQEGLYFRYKNNTYSLDDFMRLDKNSPFPSFWNGYASDTFFSGVLVHICEDDTDFIIVGTYYS